MKNTRETAANGLVTAHRVTRDLNPAWYDNFASPIRSSLAKVVNADLEQIFPWGLAPDDEQSARPWDN